MASEQTTFFARFSPDQLRAQFTKNAASLSGMASKAERTGKTVNGFRAEYLRAKATEYERLSRATDAEVRAHVNRPIPTFAERQALRQATLSVGRSR